VDDYVNETTGHASSFPVPSFTASIVLISSFTPVWTSLLTLLNAQSPPRPLGYIGEFELIDDHRGGKIVIQLNGRLNKTGVISPRFNVTLDSIENWINLLLPARSFGKIILTTSAGIMDHEEARRKHVSPASARSCLFDVRECRC
jgi:hypothetical protein